MRAVSTLVVHLPVLLADYVLHLVEEGGVWRAAHHPLVHVVAEPIQKVEGRLEKALV
jgi:hypothetical protein